MQQVVSSQEVKDYLGIDYDDDMTERRIEHSIRVADSFLVGALGRNYPKADPRAKELALMVISDIFDHRELTQKETAMYRKLAHDFELQLRLEMQGNEI